MKVLKMKSQNKKILIHFIGIGGIGMSGIAEIMNDLGYKVQGSDIGTNDTIHRLKEKGIKIFKGHNSKNVLNISAAVYSSAIDKKNAEILSCKKNSIPVVSRADMLAELMKNKKSIAIAGSHGKTTTTSIIGSILDNADLDPTIINGGIINSYSKNNKLGKGEWIVAEADESDGSFLKLPHQISIITNLDIEHLDFYKNKKNLIRTFENFILNLPFYGYSIICTDNSNLKKIVKKIKTRNIVSYSIKDKDANVFISNIKNDNNSTIFKIKINKKINNYYGDYLFKVNLLGDHNILNCTASIIASIILGIKINKIRKGIVNFKGVKRRFTEIGKKNKALIIDDYAHHPTEIKATLSAAKKISKNIIVIFQPHRYSRTNFLMKDFINILSKIENLYILKTYSAGEKIIKNATSKKLFISLRKKNKNVKYVINEKKLFEMLQKQTNKNCLIIFMGAGSITKDAYNFMKY